MVGIKTDLQGREVLLCLTGGIACYKAAELASGLVQSGAGVTVAMTESASKFITPLTFQALTNNPVYCDLWQGATGTEIGHISLTEKADLMVIAPATANILAKMTHGIADDLVSTMALSANGACPILVAPAMNSRMWQAPATVDNCQKLKDRGTLFVGPADGRLACGDSGIGRMSEVQGILDSIYTILK